MTDARQYHDRSAGPVSATPRPDWGSVAHQLITMRKSVGQLDALGPVDRAQLDRDPATGLVVERILALLADLAFAINSQLSAAVLGAVPRAPAAALGAVEKAGIIDARLAKDLVPQDGPHHLLVQLYLDSEPDRVAAVVSAALSGYGEYVRQLDHWTAAQSPPD